MNFLLDHDVPDELSYLLEHLGHRANRLRDVLPREAPDAAALEYAFHHGLIVIRRRSRAAERAALLRLIERAGPEGLGGNINFA